jgi:DNA-binding CsgD family transcriptional regulator
MSALDEGRGGVTTRITGLYVRGYVAMSRGHLDDASAMLSESLALGEPSGDILRISLPLWGLAEVAQLAGSGQRAIELTERGRLVSLAVEDMALLSPFLVTGTRARLASQTTGDARRWFEDVGGVIRSSGIGTLQPAVDHAAGLIAFAEGQTGTARTLLGEAVRGWDGVRRMWEATWARLDLAACLLRGRLVHEAVALIGDARAAADSLDSRPLAARAIELMATARDRPQFGARWAPLTAREYEVARLVATGSTNREVATQLVVTPKTVASHLEHIMNKLGVARRAEIAAWAARIEEPESDG